MSGSYLRSAGSFVLESLKYPWSVAPEASADILETLKFWEKDLDSTKNFVRLYKPFEWMFNPGPGPFSTTGFDRVYPRLKAMYRLAIELFSNPENNSEEQNLQQRVMKLLETKKAETTSALNLSEKDWTDVERHVREWRTKDDILACLVPPPSDPDNALASGGQSLATEYSDKKSDSGVHKGPTTTTDSSSQKSRSTTPEPKPSVLTDV
ncbi:hypothetical protein QFC20_001574 [Naganishia adeliensis]|uniref:Uncharacterized protein n=1 Tax=Naganishia adeliensis TaxID=92952 RepID=A0ACC2WUE1_9TREE|nr:hypothetical protein QFC20_001574 [Naganishia adeliensis]